MLHPVLSLLSVLVAGIPVHARLQPAEALRGGGGLLMLLSFRGALLGLL